MIGLILVSIGTFLDEISTLIGKTEVQNKRESVYSMAFLCLIWGTLWFLLIILYKGQFIFSAASLPTVIIRILTEIVLVYVTTLAIVKADRSTFGFVRTGTIPLLLFADLWLGYTLTLPQLTGIAILVLGLAFAFLNHGLEKNGIRLVVIATILPVITISLYKYNITHYNSVEAEQLISHVALLVFTFFMALRFGRENPIRLLAKREFFLQSFAGGIGGVLISFAYLFSSASTITAAKRAVSVLWAIFSGNRYFEEKRFLFKIVLLLFVVTGLFLLT
ncbi:MAG: hypothetical protein A2942_03290 [Candidatus Lloydbacteria bacterium RIFCSPLOWO2_01_FULL_50_20]|uniref:EamA domain-containing protein n=1 Tax=Candidatus Lloydbacteria bacterium RIFCSPLOWO2_01_FULL_50_20 TaxID=1798665 RepID=A0A1G2DKL7_9BACT|nr:MAG: hypothetical protein A3C13_00245 [Candidatus Lloydbacteria bacterium RIFCSPHIGHO2_02_FULL_50_11]OGZ13358.1 MAG: hypothetical protein A2942_03290 [Candidatus Lloydbacteria bacterium RIFCSPLOWO2_01_FULL_50_20]